MKIRLQIEEDQGRIIEIIEYPFNDWRDLRNFLWRMARMFARRINRQMGDVHFTAHNQIQK